MSIIHVTGSSKKKNPSLKYFIDYFMTMLKMFVLDCEQNLQFCCRPNLLFLFHSTVALGQSL